MNIGQKVRELRVMKMMTQSELAGNEITRNMLSRIENNAANPSLSTMAYLADRLGVPVGYLLSDGDEEFVYRKTSIMKNIKRAYADKSYEICREVCMTSFDEYDDEFELILADCCVGIAEDNIRNGRLHCACGYLDEAVVHSSKTVYSTVTQKNRIAIMFSLLKELSATLYSNELDDYAVENLLYPMLFGDAFCRYISVFLSNSRIGEPIDTVFEDLADMTKEDRLYVAHLRAKQYMMRKEYKKAIKVLDTIMNGDVSPQRLLLYLACCDMEICCKEIDDYKGAYEFAQNKMGIFEHMLTEDRY